MKNSLATKLGPSPNLHYQFLKLLIYHSTSRFYLEYLFQFPFFSIFTGSFHEPPVIILRLIQNIWPKYFVNFRKSISRSKEFSSHTIVYTHIFLDFVIYKIYGYSKPLFLQIQQNLEFYRKQDFYTCESLSGKIFSYWEFV